MLSFSKKTAVLLFAVLALTVWLAGCAGNHLGQSGSYVVQRGDTLSAIGRRYGIDWHDLARWNHLAPPYRLEVGQRISLKPFQQIDYSRVGNNGSRTTASQTAKANRSPQGQPLGRAPAPAVTRDHPQQSRADEQEAIDSVAMSTQTQNAAVKAAGPSKDGWHWPVTGKLLRAFSTSRGHHDIEIGGKKGEPVHAASSGNVVYNGTGLKGYGRLVIIKHSAEYLSAYGFLGKSYVREGQTVAAGAHIADMGLGPGNKPMLLFEIRRNGNPVDPLKLLPRR